MTAVLVACLITLLHLVVGDVFNIGYLTGSRRRPGDRGYNRPGLTISGAISLAVEEINKHHPLTGNHSLAFRVAETYGEETESILQTAILWTVNVSVYIGPQETCVHEARMAASFNLPMISYFCANHETSNKELFPTFARTRPPDTQISKSVASLLLYFNWRKVALLYSASMDSGFAEVAKTIMKTIDQVGIEVRYVSTWEETYHYGYGRNPFDALVKESYTDTRIYVVVGYYFEHLGLMVSLEKNGLLDNGEYFVVGVDVEQYDKEHPRRYMKDVNKYSAVRRQEERERFISLMKKCVGRGILPSDWHPQLTKNSTFADHVRCARLVEGCLLSRALRHAAIITVSTLKHFRGQNQFDARFLIGRDVKIRARLIYSQLHFMS